MRNDTLNRLFELLEEEAGLLLEGDIEAVAGLDARKQDLSEAMVTEDRPDPEMLAALQEKVRRNQALLEAVGRGLKSASVRLKEIRKAMLQLDTYTQNGDLQVLRNAKPTVERRA